VQYGLRMYLTYPTVCKVFTLTSGTFIGACVHVFQLCFGTAIKVVLNRFLETSHNVLLDDVMRVLTQRAGPPAYRLLSCSEDVLLEASKPEETQVTATKKSGERQWSLHQKHPFGNLWSVM